MSDKSLTPREKAGVGAAVLFTSGRIRVLAAAALLLGWLGWLGVAALTKSREPTVSRAQAAAASVPVVAEVKADEKGVPATIVKVVEPRIRPNAPPPGTEIDVLNLDKTTGFTTPGQYLLLLNPEREQLTYSVAGQQRSPGADLTGVGVPKIYRWGSDVGKQVEKLYPRAE